MKQNIHLLVIDPQNDFCDLPADWLAKEPSTGAQMQPALPVAGAHADMLRLAGLIREGAGGIDAITITLDSHHRFDIAHPTFWQSRDGGAVAPFTTITAAQIRGGDYSPRDRSALPRTLAYVDELERRGRYTLMVWPVHCEIGSWGHNVHSAVKAAYNAWEDGQLRVVEKIAKGSNPWTEHFSGVQAEVPDPEDPSTQVNVGLVRTLEEADVVLMAGEALSHCLANTVRDIAAQFSDPRYVAKIHLLRDATGNVPGFEALGEAFVRELTAKGMKLTTTTDILAAA